MSKGIPLARSWAGVWTGRGRMQDGREVRVRQEIRLVHGGAVPLYHFEAYDVGLEQLIHGVRSYLAQDASGRVATVTYSTLFGLVTFEMTPDDDGVLALAGESEQGHKLTYSLVEQEDGSLFFTVFWREVESESPGDSVPSMTGVFHRLQPGGSNE